MILFLPAHRPHKKKQISIIYLRLQTLIQTFTTIDIEGSCMLKQNIEHEGDEMARGY